MIDKLQQLEFSAEELAVIEAALHTQSKILNVQARAGSKGAREELNKIKRTLARVSQETTCVSRTDRPCRTGWFGMARIFG